MNAVVISLGGVHAATLGCYGGEWVDTTAIDRFAADALVFDHCFVECPSPQTTRRNWWTGCFQHVQSREPQGAVNAPQSLIADLQHKVRAVLIHDTALLGHRPELEMAGFEQIIEIERRHEDTTNKVFDAAMQWLAEHSDRQPFLLFVDCHGAHPPWFGTDQEIDPYLLAVRDIDEQLDRFLDYLRDHQEWEQTLLMITSDVGRSAEESAVQDADQFGLGELRIHVPLIVRQPGMERMGRCSALVQSIDLIPTVLDALEVSTLRVIDGFSLIPICRLSRPQVRDVARLACPEFTRAVRTSNWYLVETQSALGENEMAVDTKLFVKPDDRWDRNDVAKQYPEVIAELNQFW